MVRTISLLLLSLLLFSGCGTKPVKGCVIVEKRLGHNGYYFIVDTGTELYQVNVWASEFNRLEKGDIYYLPKE